MLRVLGEAATISVPRRFESLPRRIRSDIYLVLTLKPLSTYNLCHTELSNAISRHLRLIWATLLKVRMSV